ncbi:MAG TPA: acyltransferase [Allosphingosinicella sp.]
MTIEGTNGAGARIADLDALRGLAALAVVLYHYTTRYDELYSHDGTLLLSVPWGHYGVQLFFGISGFVIFMTLGRTRNLVDFAVSRASRLYPAYWTAMAATTAAMLIAGMDSLLVSPAVFAADLTMLQGFVGLPAVDGVYWTLGVELAFYVAMAALFQLRLLDRIEPVLIGWMGLHWLWTFAPALAGIEPSWLLGALVIQADIAWFAIGIAAYRIRSAADPGWPLAVIAASLATIAACDGLAALAVAAVTAALLLLVALRGIPVLGARPLVWLGAVSYSLYLLHQYIGFALIGRLEAAGLDPHGAIAVTLAAVLLLAAAVTFLVERPALKAIRAWYRGRAVPAASAAPA